MQVRRRNKIKVSKGNDLHRWTVSFADFMTLMFAVFVVLYAVSSNKEEKYKDVVMTIQNASKLLNKSIFTSNQEGILDKHSNSLIADMGPAILSDDYKNKVENKLSHVDISREGEDIHQLKEQIKALLSSEVEQNLINVEDDGDWLTVEVGGQLLFAQGSHTLLISAQKLLKKLSVTLTPIDNMLRIRGYSDQEKISNEIYFSNWELSGARAFSVLHALSKLGVAEKRMVMEAYGSYNPITDINGNVDPLASRRVVIAISRYAIVEEPIVPVVQITEKEISEALPTSKPDLEKMHELHLPNNRLIITTRQE